MNGVIPGGESYETMSGTSMAAPPDCRYGRCGGPVPGRKPAWRIRKTLAPCGFEPEPPHVHGAATEGWGELLPVIQQGAGLANVGSAISASSYVLVDGQPDGKVKAELGDDPDRTGAYQFRFTLNNLTNESQNYLLSAELFTQAVEEDYASEDEMGRE